MDEFESMEFAGYGISEARSCGYRGEPRPSLLDSGTSVLAVMFAL